MLTRGRVLLATAFILFLLGANYYAAAVRFSPSPAAAGGVAWVTEPVNEEGEYAFWGERIGSVGGEKAYSELSAYASQRDFPSQHTLAHLFGRALFEQEDLSGISVCDDRFSYGCFHEFFAYAVNGHGLPVIAQLNEECQKQPDFLKSVACQHGIGHGILSFSGYGEANLFSALEACKTLPNAGTMGGCYAGVFMEYNRRSMIATESGPRLPADGDFISPCDDVKKEYRAVCAVWQPLWWQAEIFEGEPTPEVMKMFGSMCRALGEATGFAEACFYGIGFVVAPESATEDPDALKMCPEAADTPQEEKWCLNYAAYIAGALVDDANGLAVCKDMTDEERALCERYARTTTSVLKESEARGF
jgi:hypothetical protein